MTSNQFYFNEGDGIEICGQFFGLVKLIEGDLMWIQKNIISSFPETVLENDLTVYKNGTEQYFQDKYWIKKCSAPTEFSFIEPKTLT